MRIEATFLNPSWNYLEELLCSAHNSIFISSPWISKEGTAFLQSVIQKLSGREIHEIELWTRFDPADFLFETSDHAGILSTLRLCSETLNKIDLQIWTYQRLHAKVYAVDGKRALITSSNLTQGGFMENIEVAIAIEGEAKIAHLFKALRRNQKQMTKVSVREVENFVKSLQKIEKAKEHADKAMTLLSNSRVTSLGYGRRKQRAPPYIPLR